MSEVEFEEVMGRNRTVSSSAISRAVQDAATGMECSNGLVEMASDNIHIHSFCLLV